MDETKLNKTMLKMAKDLMSVRSSLPLSVACAVANYKMSNIAGQMRIKIDTKSGYGNSPANIYQLTLAGSGAGKNSSAGLIDRFYFRDAFDYMAKEVYPRYKEVALAKLESEGEERPLHNWVKALSNSTTSGLFAYAESFQLCNVGGIALEIDEIGNAIISKAELFEILLTPYDTGDFPPVAKRTDSNSMSISGMPVTMYAFGNKSRLFEGDNVENAFLQLLVEGYARRFIFADDTSEPERRTAVEIIAEMELAENIAEKRVNDRLYIKSLISKANLHKVLPFNREAFIMFATIKADGDNYIIDNKNMSLSVKADMSERNFKTAKLAGIYAFFDGSDVITGKNMEEAFAIIKESSRVLAGLVKIRPKHERLLDAMLLEDNPVTSQHLLSYSFIPSSYTKKILEYVDLAKELASERGLLWKEIQRKGVSYYSVSWPKEDEMSSLDSIDKVEKEEAIARKMNEEELMAFLND
jgi:hypothetical protein